MAQQAMESNHDTAIATPVANQQAMGVNEHNAKPTFGPEPGLSYSGVAGTCADRLIDVLTDSSGGTK